MASATFSTASGLTPTDAPALAVVIPVLNEAAVIASLIADVRQALDGGAPYEIIVVDDGSTDETPALLAGMQAADPERFRPVRHRRRSGQSAAVASGVRAARAPAIATLDGDGQNDPADIPALLEAWRQMAQPERSLVAGRRAKRRDTWAKRMASRIANRVRSRLLGDDTPDTGCGLKVFSRAAFLALPQFDHMHRFLPALTIRAGGTVRSVAVNHRPRGGGTSKYGVWDRLWVGIADLAGVMWLMRRRLAPDVVKSEVKSEIAPPPSEPPASV